MNKQLVTAAKFEGRVHKFSIFSNIYMLKYFISPGPKQGILDRSHFWVLKKARTE